VSAYSRILPQPVHDKLQAWSGSSIRTRGKYLSPEIFFRKRYPAIERVREKGNRIFLFLGMIYCLKIAITCHSERSEESGERKTA
jgi:hypothetical protein